MDDSRVPLDDNRTVLAVTTREELVFLLSRASELEHGLACIYLFAAHSLKSDVTEGGLTESQAKMVRNWKRRLAHVAVEEMLHLAQVSNLLTAIGGSPRFARANFPMPSSAFPFGLRLTLEPFSLETIERFVCYEMPEAGVLSPEKEAIYNPIRERILSAEKSAGERSPDGGGAPLRLDPVDSGSKSEPFEIDFRTVGEFYRKIRSGFDSIPEEDLFIGPPEAQANARFVDLQGALVAVLGRDSACAAIDMVIEQGEAPSSAHPDAHFVVFDSIRREFEEAMESAKNTGEVFEPVRPVGANPMTRFYDDSSCGNIIEHPITHAIADLFNVAYETMLLMLLRFFAHTEETEAELEHLSRATLRMMTTVLRPLGEALTMMPIGGSIPGRTAGPGFGYNRDVSLLPHKRSAWTFFGERLRELANVAASHRFDLEIPTEFEEAVAALEDLAQQFAPSGRSWNPATELKEFEQSLKGQRSQINPELNGPYLVTNVTTLENSRGELIQARPEMALCRCGGSANKPFCDGTHAAIGFESSKLEGRTADRRDSYSGREITVLDNRGICQHAGFCTDNLPAVFKLHQEPWIDPNGDSGRITAEQIQRCPSGALAFSGIDVQVAARESKIIVSKNGPYRVTGEVALRFDLWGEGASKDHYALCRCGGSKNKPFCDGSHWYNSFTDDRN